MERSLICGIDGAESTQAVTATATRLASLLGDRLLLAYVVEPPPPFPYGRELHRQRERHQDASDAERLLSSIDVEGDAERRILHGDPVQELASLAEEEGADLLIVGSGGEGPVKAALLGSVARDLPRQSPCPVMVLPPKARERVDREGALSGRTLVCAVDFSEESASAAAAAARFSSRLGLELVLVYAPGPSSSHLGRAPLGAMPPPDLGRSEERIESAAGRKLEEFAERALEGDGEKCRRRVIHGLPVAALKRAAEEEGAALVAVGNRGFGAVRTLLGGSTSGELAAGAPTPVLVVPGHVSRSSDGGSLASSRRIA